MPSLSQISKRAQKNNITILLRNQFSEKEEAAAAKAECQASTGKSRTLLIQYGIRSGDTMRFFTSLSSVRSFLREAELEIGVAEGNWHEDESEPK